MLINSMDNVISLYDINKIDVLPPRIYTGHKSTFFGMFYICDYFLVKANFGVNEQYIASGSQDN